MTWNPENIEAKIGISFKDKNLLRLALTHPSFAQQIGFPSKHNQRLEFLGDAILNLVVADYLYRNFPYLKIAKLSPVRDKLVRGKRLVRLWFELGLGEELLLGRGEERNCVREKGNDPFEDAFEALLGAIYLDRGFSLARNWVVKHAIAPLLERHLKNLKERSQPIDHLKFLGDAVLKAVASNYLYHKFPHLREGVLTDLRQGLICSQKLAEFSLQIAPDEFIPPATTFKALLGKIYLNLGFSETCKWLGDRFISPN